MTKDNVKMNQFQIGKDIRVELQIPPSLNRHFRATEENLRLGGRMLTLAPWADNSGGVHHQLGFIDQSIYYRNGLPQSATWGQWVQLLMANSAGNVGIGTANPAFKLDVIGTVRAREVRVDMSGADFVFEPGYSLMPLAELKSFVQTNRHLPEIQPASEMQQQGVNVGELNTQLLQKIEELTLYVIQLKEEIDLLKGKMNANQD